MQEDVGAGDERRQGFGLAHIVQADDATRRRLVTSRADQQQAVGVAQPGHRVDHGLDVLFSRGPPGERQQSGAGRQAKLSQKVAPPRPVGMEELQIDPQRLDLGAGHSGLGQPLGHMAAGRHHLVEASENLGPLPAGGVARPFPEMEGGEGRGVGVAEADHRPAQSLTGLDRRKSWHEDVARFDDVGLHQADRLRPAGDAGGHSVAVAKGQPGGRDAYAPGRQLLGPPTGGHDGVDDVWTMAPQPVGLGQEVAFHPAAAGGEHHRGIEQVKPGRRASGGQRATLRGAAPNTV